MSKNLYENLNVNDFDKFDCVRLSWWFYLSVTYILRGYLVWGLSIANIQDSTSFISFIYSDPRLLYINLLSGLIGIFLLIVISLRRPNANSRVKKIWPKMKLMIIVTLLLDYIITLSNFLIWELLTLKSLIFHSVIVIILLSKAFNNKRIAVNLLEFPEVIEVK